MAIFPEKLKLGNPFVVVEGKNRRIIFANKMASDKLGVQLDRLLNSSLDELEIALASSLAMNLKDLQKALYSQIITTGEHSFLFFNSDFSIPESASDRYISPFTIAIVEANTVISRVSGSFEVLTGYKKWEIENRKSFLEFVAPSMRNMLKDLQVLRYSKEYPPSDEYALEIQRKDGTKRSVLVKIEFIDSTKQSVLFVMDISAQKTVEAFMKSRLKFAGTLGRITLKILSLKDGDIFKFLIDELEKNKKELNFKSLSLFLKENGKLRKIAGKPEKRECFNQLQLLLEKIKPGDGFIFLPFDTSSGRELILPIFFRGILYAVVVFHGWKNRLLDSPESREAMKAFQKAVEYLLEIEKASKALKEHQEKTRFLLKFHESGIWEAVVDEEGIHYRNDFQWLAALGYSERSLRRKSWNDVVDPRDQIILKKGIREYIEGKANYFQASYRVINSSGNLEWFRDEGRFYEELGGEKRLIGIRRKVTESMLTWEKLKYVSFHDKLTGLYNRSFFEEEIARFDSERQVPLSVIMGDVNGLKLVNDAFGHVRGDELLKKTAEVLKGSVRKEDVVARWGGDEFIILLPKANEEIVENVAERIRTSASRELIIESINFSISLGYATRKDLRKTISSLIREAEDLMYRNKVLESNLQSRTVLTALENALFEYSSIEATHCKNVEELALEFGRELNMDYSTMAKLRLLARYHDIGKLAVPSNIIMKSGKLSRNEWKVVKSHPEVGYRIARSTLELSSIAEEILSHHENWDGTGYPRSLKEELIPYLARVISVVNAFEAMTNFRPYRKTLSIENALLELEKHSGTQFDPHIARKFAEFVRGKKTP
ncbi:hypothetical protein AT15_04715 [Kosmotoga arenicorallina S304]|uniref:Diguanylate cyclase n=1 Tax=Kosmotoga arenicorallina S304 TaxID=1453497 RepID=A0A176JWD4_9BACT|nr:diguanylate cyclase [Kosmotoga arenicorallina]OAA27993.1 hypothetical protein AT15_04715 [Kosmotoga arenicorallina S304]